MMRVFKVEETLIKKIKKIQLRTLDKFSSLIFTNRLEKIFEDIYLKKNLKALTGSEAVNIC